MPKKVKVSLLDAYECVLEDWTRYENLCKKVDIDPLEQEHYEEELYYRGNVLRNGGILG